MDESQNSEQLQGGQTDSASPSFSGEQKREDIQKPESPSNAKAHSLAITAVILGAIVAVIAVILALLPGESPVQKSFGVDKDGVPIRNFSKSEVIERVASDRLLDEPDTRAIFRWVVENPDEAARLSEKEKADIIRSLNE